MRRRDFGALLEYSEVSIGYSVIGTTLSIDIFTNESLSDHDYDYTSKSRDISYAKERAGARLFDKHS